MAEAESIYPVLAEKFKADKRRELGLDAMSDEELFATFYTFLHVLPTERLWRLAGKLSTSRSEREKLSAQQLAVILYMQEECNRLVHDLTPQQQIAIAAEVFADESLAVNNQSPS